MGDRTSIEWAQATWNPVRGCSSVSEGCRHCYAQRQAHRMNHEGGAYEGLTKMTPSGPKWTGEVRTVPQVLARPLRWRRPRRVFVNSMSDLWHEEVPDEFIDQVFAVMALAPHHVFQVLTKRPERMVAYVQSRGPEDRRDRWTFSLAQALSDTAVPLGRAWPLSIAWPLPNVWLGTSVEDQATADERIPHLLAAPAAVRWISAEPLLGPVDLRRWMVHEPEISNGRCRVCGDVALGVSHARHPSGGGSPLDWVVVGGESGPGARPCDVQWIRSIVEQCKRAGVAVFVKQVGAQPGFKLEDEERRGNLAPSFHHYDHDAELWIKAMDDPKGGDPQEWPDEIRIREYPETAEASAP